MSFIGESLDFIDSGESSFSKFSDGFVQIVEAILIQVFGEVFKPDFKERLTFEVKIDSLVVFPDESETYFFGGGCELRVNFSILLVKHLKLKIELELAVVEVLAKVRVRGADGNVKVGHCQSELMGVLGMSEDISMKTDGVFLDV